MRTASEFQVVTTADGSPSLGVADTNGYVEKMHHAGGAMSETLYIYGAALELMVEKGWPFRVLSLGLGLGYNEILAAAYAVRSRTSPQDSVLLSFETERVLVTGFQSWVRGEAGDFHALYEEILTRAGDAIGVLRSDIKEWLGSALQAGRWEIRGAFPEEIHAVSDISCVLYDAFSNKMNRELWDESVLKNVMTQICAKNCVFATYAATGSLNRALRSSGFMRTDKVGFAGKRQSTFALRENL